MMQSNSPQDWSCDFKVEEADVAVDDVVLSFKVAKVSTKSRNRGKPTPCPICGVIIANSYSFSCHMRRHKNDKPFKCSLCPASFILQHELKVHSIIHSDNFSFKCDMCEKSFKTKSGKRCHEDSHGLNEYICRHCPEKFTKFVTRSKHETSVHKKGEFKCSYCYKEFVSQEFKIEHEGSVHNKPKKKQMHKKKTLPVINYDSKSILNSSDNKGKTPYFRCKICSERFSFRKDQISHIYNVHPEEADKHVRTCNICGKKFTGQYFRYHMRAHVGVKPHACSLCDFKAPRKDELKTHMSVHSDEAPYLCSHCGKRFKSKRSWELCEAKHAGKKELMCHICDKTFFTSTVLARHITQVHSKKKCNICGLEISPLYLTAHIKKEHTNKCSEVCDICGKVYKNRSSFNYHLRTHTNEINRQPKLRNTRYCPYCDHQSPSRSGLLKHCSFAHPTKIFQCNVCPYMNLNTNKQNEHMQLHMKDSSYDIFFSVTLESSLEKERECTVQECFICGFQSVFEFKMDEHLDKHEAAFQKFGGFKKKYEKNKNEENDKRSKMENKLEHKIKDDPSIELDYSPSKVKHDYKSKKVSQFILDENMSKVLPYFNYERPDIKIESLNSDYFDVKSEYEESLLSINSDNESNSIDYQIYSYEKSGKQTTLCLEPKNAISIDKPVNNLDLKDKLKISIDKPVNKLDLKDKLQTINGKKFIALEDLYNLRNFDISSIFKQVNNLSDIGN